MEKQKYIKTLAHIGFGLTTYVVILVNLIGFIFFGGVEAGLFFTGLFVWVLTIPAFFIATVGLFLGGNKKLNIATLIIAILVTICNVIFTYTPC